MRHVTPREIEGVTTRLRRKEINARYYKRKKDRELGSKERTVLMQLRLPETLVGRVHRCVNDGLATGRFPWRTASEAVKDLILRGFGTLKGDELVDEMWPALQMMKQLDHMEAQRREAQIILNKARSVIGELLAIKAYEQAAQFFHITWEGAQQMPPTTWRDWTIAKLREAFPELAKAHAPGVILTKAPAKKLPIAAPKGRKR